MHIVSLQRPRPREDLTIGKIAGLASCSVPTIRYYEEIGLLPAAKRRTSGHRTYNEATVELLMFIRQCRDLGFGIDYIRSLIELSNTPGQDCGAVRDIAQKRLEVVRAKLLELRALEESLSSFVDACAKGCTVGPAPDCSIFTDIAKARLGDGTSGCCG